MINWYKKVVFENYVNFSGRARRSEYWYFTLFNFIISLLLMGIDKALGLKIGISNLYSLAVLLPGLAVSVRRLHDIGKSGKLLLLFYILIIVLAIIMAVSGLSFFTSIMSGTPDVSAGTPGLGFFIPLLLIVAMAIGMLVLYCTPGETGSNKYGPDPKMDGEEMNEIGTE